MSGQEFSWTFCHGDRQLLHFQTLYPCSMKEEDRGPQGEGVVAASSLFLLPGRATAFWKPKGDSSPFSLGRITNSSCQGGWKSNV